MTHAESRLLILACRLLARVLVRLAYSRDADVLLDHVARVERESAEPARG